MASDTVTSVDVAAGSIVVFDDPGSPKRENFNQVGIILSGNSVVFIRRQTAVEMPLDQVLSFPAALVLGHTVPGLRQKVEAFFEHNRSRTKIVAAGLRALQGRSYGIFDRPDVMPVFGAIPSQVEYEAAWTRVTQQLVPGDAVLIFEQESLLDRFIAWIDYGSWSHAAIYAGEGVLFESIPGRGVVKRRLADYHDRYIRLGIYRDSALTQEQVLKGLRATAQTVGQKYNYRDVLKLGLKKLRMRLMFGDSADGVKDGATPNDLVYSGRLSLIDYV